MNEPATTQRLPDHPCTCGHVFSNHRPLYEHMGDDPVAWRCDESDGCMDFRPVGMADGYPFGWISPDDIIGQAIVAEWNKGARNA